MVQTGVPSYDPGGPTPWDRLTWRLRMALASYRTASEIGAGVTVLHVDWLSRSAHPGEVVTGYGAALVVLGVWVAGFPLIHRGLQRVGPEGPRYVDQVLPEFRHFVTRREAEQDRYKLRRDQIDERVVGVMLALLGTLLNGYGTPLARLAGWEH